ncbi:MAG: LPS-assembly protein LptD [Elusimicrobia bacterium]|nr:LPS-assembly protein LptD [Elusimicrobiota bacterium]
MKTGRILFIFLSVFISGVIFGGDFEMLSSTNGFYEINCDFLKYDGKNEVAYSSGNVRIKKSGLELFSDKAVFNRKENRILLDGSVRITDSTTTITCVSADYNIRTDTALLKGVRVFQKPFYIAGREALKKGDEYFFKDAYITTCDLIPPHYKISCSRMRLKREDDVSMWNVFLSFHGIPVLYFPYYWQKIGDKKWDLSVRAGNSSTKGGFVKTKFIWRFTKKFKVALLNDYFGKLGYGKGIEMEYKKTDLYSDFYAYHINEKNTGLRNINVKQRHWQRLPRNFILQLDFEWQDYSTFDWDYRKDEVLVAKPTYLRSRGSVSRSAPDYYFRFSGYRNETLSGIDFVPSEVNAPEVYFRLNPHRLLFLKYDLSYDFLRKYYPSGGFADYTNIHSANFRIYESYRLLRWFTFFPRLGYSFHKIQSRSPLNYYFHNVNFSLNFYRPVRLDFTHNYKIKTDGSVVLNTVSFADEYRPFHGAVFRQFVTYDIGKKAVPFGYRFSALSNKLEMRIFRLKFYYKNYFQIPTAATTYWEAETGNGFFSTRLAHSAAEKNFVNLFQRFNFSLGKWRIMLRGRFYFRYNGFKMSSDSLTEKEISVKRNLHCWDMFLRYLVTPSRREFWVFFNVAAFPNKPMGVYHDAVDGEWSFRKK